MKPLLFLLVACAFLFACRPDSPSSASSTPSPSVFLSYRPTLPGELPLLTSPPVTPRCTLLPLSSPTGQRHYLACDLNSDGTPEYFVENYTGAHAINFALINSRGKLLTFAKDVGNLGGDRILVLTSTHHHYHDLLSSDSDATSIIQTRWHFNGTRYIPVSHRTYYDHNRAHYLSAFIETRPATTLARWYADMWARPSRDLPFPETPTGRPEP